MLATVICFILIFTIIVVAHELGHFLLARKNGIHVTEFFIGMGPSIFSFTRGGTKYSLKIFPIGGACVFEGENGQIEKEGYGDVEVDGGNAKPEPGEGSFLKASAWARFSAIIAGPIFNFFLAYLLGLVIVAYAGTDRPVLGMVAPGGQAEAAGLQEGDLITKINNESIHLYRQIYFISYTSRGETLQVTYERDGVENSVTVTPAYNEELGRYLLGVDAYGPYSETEGLGIFASAFHEVQFGVTSTLKSLGMMLQGRLGGDDVAGPLGMAMIVGETYEVAKTYGFLQVLISMLNITMILSVNLGIMNLLPLPALDGGRLVFIVIELIRGKPIPPEREGVVHLAGMIALMVLMVVVLFNDITKFF